MTSDHARQGYGSMSPVKAIVTASDHARTKEAALYRVQDHSGRGPYQPGLSHRWSSPDGPVVKPWWTEIGASIREAIMMLPPNMHIGCAFADMDKLESWFTPDERKAMAALGFYIVRMRADKIVVETPTQIVFANRRPLFKILKHKELAS